MNTHIETIEDSEIQKSDKGFTLIELLIVIVILGILATVTVFAVRGITDRGQDSACAADLKTVEVAVEAWIADNGLGDPPTYPTEAQLVSGGFMRSESDLHDVGAAGAVTPTAGGDCA